MLEHPKREWISACFVDPVRIPNSQKSQQVYAVNRKLHSNLNSSKVFPNPGLREYESKIIDRVDERVQNNLNANWEYHDDGQNRWLLFNGVVVLVDEPLEW